MHSSYADCKCKINIFRNIFLIMNSSESNESNLPMAIFAPEMRISFTNSINSGNAGNNHSGNDSILSGKERLTRKRHRQESEANEEDSPPISSAHQHHHHISPIAATPLIAWPPVPFSDYLCQSPPSLFINKPPQQLTTPTAAERISRRRFHSPAAAHNSSNHHHHHQHSTGISGSSNSSSTSTSSPLRHIQTTLKTARSFLQRIEYARVPEENEQQQTSEQQRRNSSRQQKSRRNLQRSRRIQNSSSSRPFPAACPYNNGSIEKRMPPYKLDIVFQMPELLTEEAEKFAWDPNDRSINLYVKEEDRLTIHRHPVAQSTDCIRGKIGFTRGFHVWEIVWPSNQRGTHAVVGVATKNAPLHVAGYTSLVGYDEEGYGWNIVENKCYHDAKNAKGWTYPSEQQLGQPQSLTFRVPEKIYCILDMDEGHCSFATETKFLGTAFCGLKGKKLYPAISAVWGHCEITMKYIGGLDPEPRKLLEICRQRIRLELGATGLSRADELNLPPRLRQYLL